MSTIKINSSQALFDEIHQIAFKLDKHSNFLKKLSEIVQNDMEVSEEDLQEFKKIVKNSRDKTVSLGTTLELEIKEWWGKVITHIGECNKEGGSNG